MTLNGHNYLYLPGRAGGQIAYGGTASGEDLTLGSTSNATKGNINFGSYSTYDEVNRKLGINVLSPIREIDIGGHISCTQISAPGNGATAALAGVGAGSVNNGVHRYLYSFESSTGETGWNSTYDEVTVINNTLDGKVQLSNIAQSTDARVTGIKIYRTKSTDDSTYYLLTTLAHGTTTYLDNSADASLGSTPYVYKDNDTAFRMFLNGNVNVGRFSFTNTGFGYVCLNSLTSGFSDIGIGAGCLRSCTSGAVNIAVGIYCLENLTVGSRNLAIGNEAMSSTTIGTDGMAIGFQALQAATSHVGAIAIGYNSLTNSTTATGMTAFGHQSGYAPGGNFNNYCTTSTYCTFIGANTGLGSTTQRTKSIAIGYKAVVDADNTCVIGGQGSDAVDTILTKNLTVGIGAAGTDYTLTFNGETNDGVITWMEDEDYLKMSDGILMETSEEIFFRDSGLKIFSQADGYLNIVSDTGTRLGDATPTNYTQFDSTGHQTMVGTAKPWDDLRIEPTVRAAAGAGVPAFEKYFDDVAGTSKGVYLYSFTDESVAGNEKEVFFTMQMPHAWDGGPISMHVHFVPASTVASSDIVWGLEYTWKDIGETFGDTTIVYSSTTLNPDDANIIAGKHYIAEFADLTPGTTADGLSSILIGRLFRNSSSGSDTYTDKVGLLYIDAHYQINSLGSTDEYTK